MLILNLSNGNPNSSQVQARSGGHSYASFSTGGQDGTLVIDLASLNGVSVFRDGSASIDGGVRLGNLDEALFNQGRRAMSHGTCSNIGIGGHITHGGYGYDSRLWGLALDHITALECVLADGSIKYVSPNNEEDLYWVSFQHDRCLKVGKLTHVGLTRSC